MLTALFKQHLSKELIRQLLVFGCVGVAATATHYFIALGANSFGQVDLYLANILGYVSAVAISYFGHGRFTFKQTLNWTIFTRFVVVSLGALGASELLLLALQKTFAPPEYISLAVVVCTIPVLTFVMSKLWVFSGAASR
ncbi:GtrA family protein [Teredinibacter waterburyi]|uniref:GtrA family protein n=1 Tax=Teredinibacter waterburyi TaxID=1500538 RepID=UPI00165FE68D|nr:GtrA family protein [Teredinibacter waterburyi]